MQSRTLTSRLAQRATVALVAAMLPALSFAQGLPTIENPTRGTGSGIMETIRNYGYDIIMLVALLVVASMFIGVCYHAYGTYAEIHTGRKTWGQFGLTVAIGAVLLVIGIWLLTEATGIRKQVQAMSEHQHIRADGTVTFLPHRLNRHPVVVRGLTADELWVCCGLSGAAGLLVGAPLSWVFRTIAIAPTFIVVGVALGVFVGGGILRRLKRGRPDTWLYRQLQWRIATRHPLMAGWVGGHVLISRSGFWTTCRSTR